MTRPALPLLVLAVAFAGACNCEELLATRRPPGPEAAAPTRVEPVAAAAPAPDLARAAPPAQVPAAAAVRRPTPLPAPPPEAPAADAQPPVDDPPELVPQAVPTLRPLRPVRFPAGFARGAFGRFGQDLQASPPPSDETKAQK